MTIGKKFVLVYTIFLITVLAGAYFVFKATLSQNANRTVANLAGRQGMLAQKYTKEFINELVPLQVRNSTLKTAEIVTEQIVQDRKAYTKNIIGKLKRDGVTDVHPNKNYNDLSGGIPLPATFVKEVSDTINQRGIYSYDLLSKWNINKEKGLRTDFEKEAFDYLYSQKDEIFYSFMVHNGLYTLRYATTDIAGEACARCHNAHEDSPRHDFQVGDVMGILVVNIPIGTISKKTEAFFATSEDKDFGADSFLKTEKVFNTTMNALINGGEAPLDFEMTKFTDILPTDDHKILSKLNDVKQLWGTIKENLKKLMKAEINSAEYIVAYSDSYDSANATMIAMTEAVDMYTANSEKRSAMLLWFQGGSVFVVCLVIGIGWICFAQPLISFLKKFVSNQVKISDRVALASEQVSSSSHTLAQGATEQASSLEETSASMEEMSAMTKQNTQNAEETSKLVEVCTSAAEDGNKAAAEVSNAMGEITESSKKIAEITKVIDGIASQTNNLAVKAGQDTSQIIKQGNSFAVVAKEVRNLANKSTSAAKNTRTIVDGCIAFVKEFENESDEHKEFRENIKKIARGIKDIESIAYQTNLRALNAAVEAARASDNGEKFAAVTEEVSNLAKKSASAAKDTTTLINECVQKAVNGTKVADKCKESMENIVKDVKRASALTREITEASSEQSEGINQVTQAVQQMDQVTQQAAASAEETASASEELASQAHTMQEQIDVLAKQVSGNGNVELSTHQPANPGWDRLRLEGDVDQETPCLASEQEIVIKKTTNNIVFKLFFSPIYILRYTLKKIFKVSEQDGINIGNKSGSAGGVTHTKDSTETVPGNGNDTENVLAGTASNDSVIPMGTGETKEHDNRFKDF